MDGLGSSPQAGALIAGKYRVDRVLGRGGMGLVLGATHVTLGHEVAIKLLLHSSALTPEAVARFLREARVTARLKSIHVAKTLDMGQLDDGRPFIVMEFLQGRDVGAELESRGSVAVPEAVGWVLQACEGLAEAHAAGIVHRDLKPANLFLARDPAQTDIVKVLDFGISKLASDDGFMTSEQATFGSPVYMSPEQMMSAKGATPRSDIWALGVILYESLTGQLPFFGETVFAIAQAVVSGVPVPMNRHRPDLPPELTAIVSSCLAKDPEARPATVADLADALAPFAGPSGRERAERVRRALGQLPQPPTSDRVIDASRSAHVTKAFEATEEQVPAPPPPPPPSRGPSVRRRSAAFALAAAATLALTLGGAVVVRHLRAETPLARDATTTGPAVAMPLPTSSTPVGAGSSDAPVAPTPVAPGPIRSEGPAPPVSTARRSPPPPARPPRSQQVAAPTSTLNSEFGAN